MNTYKIYINSIDEFINHNDINSVKNSVDALEKELINLESSVSDYANNGNDLAVEILQDLQIMQEYIKKGKEIIEKDLQEDQKRYWNRFKSHTSGYTGRDLIDRINEMRCK